MRRKYFLITGVLCLLLSSLFSLNSWAGESKKTPNYSNQELLTQMLVVNVTEQRLHNLSALTITFSQDLPTELQADQFITLTQAGKLVRGSWVQAENTRRLYFTNIQPDTNYRIQVRPGIESKSGLKLKKPADYKVKTRSIKPAFDFATKGSILPAKLTSGLPIRVVNVPEIDVEFLRVKPDQLKRVVTRTYMDRLDIWDLNNLSDVTHSVYQTRYATNAQKNASETFVLPIEDITQLKEAGLYFAVMRKPGYFDNDEYRITYFVVTNIGLHARLYKNKLEVFANALDTGKPLPDLPFTLQGKKEKLTATSNEAGQVGFERLPKGKLLLTTQKDKQIAFLELKDASLDLSEYKIEGEPDQAIKPFIYSNRDLYRPGETANLSVILRDRDGLPTKLNSLHWRIVRPDNKVFHEQNLIAQNKKLGYFQQNVRIPADAPTGTWRAEVRLDPKDKSPLNRFDFQVEEFMPERMRLVLKQPSKQALLKQDKLAVFIQGDYLYGAPAAGNKVTGRYSASLLRHPIKEDSEFYFGDVAEKKVLPNEALSEIKLGANGDGSLKIPDLPKDLQFSPVSVYVLANLHEPSGRTVTRSISQAVWPADALVGVKPLFDEHIAEENKPARFEVARMNRAGKKLASTDIAATLIRVEKEYFWEYSSSSGWKRNHVKHEYPLTQQALALEDGKSQTIEFPVNYGGYRLELEDQTTKLKTTYNFHAGWKWSEGGKGAKPDQVQMTLDKKSYKAGETARLTAVPPQAGDAIVTVEGDQLLWSKRVSLPAEGSTIDIEVKDDWARHDLYISVIALRPASKTQKITPNRAIGVIHLPLNREDRKVALSIEAPEKIRPEQIQVVTVKAKELRDKTAIVTVSAVDVGVLNITDFETPDPFDYYFKRHRYGVEQYDDYQKIIESVDGKALSQRYGGGSSKSGGNQNRAEVQIVSLFSGAIDFDEEGKAQVKFAIPGFDGTLRLSAVAVTEEQFGSVDKDMIVSSPVVAALSSARFLANGDQSFAVVDLNNTTEKEKTVNLAITANDLLSLQGESEQVHTLAAGERKTLRLPITAGKSVGVGHIRLKLMGEDFVANRSVSFNIRPAYPMQTRISRWTLNEKSNSLPLSQELANGLIPETIKATLSLSPSPILNTRSALDNLLQYPYGCLEQTTSTAYPYLYLDQDIVEALALTPIDQATRSERVQSALSRLAGMQLSDGNFTLWGSYGNAEYWLTPFVVNFLLDAKEQGFNVPQRMIDQGNKALKGHLNEGYRSINSRYRFAEKPAHLDFAARAFAGYVLARQGQASLGTLRALYDKDAAKSLSGLPLAHIGFALDKMGDKRRAKAALTKALMTKRDSKAYLGDYGSVVRDDALLLALFLRHKADIPSLNTRIEALSAHIYEREYFSTQEQVAIFLLSQQLFSQQQQSWSARLTLQEATQKVMQKGLYTQTLQAADLSTDIQLTPSQALYANLSVKGYTEQAPAQRSDVMAIQRKWYNLKGELLKPEQIKAGDLVLTHLKIDAKKAIHDALVIDLLPAGFELENTNIVNTPDINDVVLKDINQKLYDWLGEEDLRTEEFRDDRYVAALSLKKDATHHLFYLARVVSAGEFTIPPAFVEDMYRPELFGIGESIGSVRFAQP